MNPIEQFKDSIRASGLTPPDVIIADGTIKRFSSNGKRDDNAGWYICFLDGISAGSFGDWRSGESTTWRADIGRELTATEKQENRSKIEKMKRERAIEQQLNQDNAREKASRIWANSESCIDHLYLTNKNIKSHGIRMNKGCLVIPLLDKDTLHSLQFINSEGAKKFLFGGKVKGCYHTIGDLANAERICIAEGYATGATIHEATGYPVIIAFNAGNLLLVAKTIHAEYPNIGLYICGDVDSSGVGQKKAAEAAEAVNGEVKLPSFTEAELSDDNPPSDFNDYANIHDIEAVKSIVSSESEVSLDYESTVTWLAKLKPFEYDRVRVEQAKSLKVQLSTLDKAVKDAQLDSFQEDPPFIDIEPYPTAIVPTLLLDDVTKTILRFIVLEPYQARLAALWVAACWFVDVIHAAPIMLINAPEKACGKTQLLTVLGKLAPRATQASGISSSCLFRMIEAYQPTLFIDEIETVLKDNDELRGLINAGHTRDSAFVWRNVKKGDDFEPKQFTVWGMKAIAGINAIKLAETVTSRSIIIELRRKKGSEKVQRLREAEPDLFSESSAKLARFASDNMIKVAIAQPLLPDELGDREQDNFEPLFAIADVAGGHWPETARVAALKLSGSTLSVQSIANELLASIQEVFETKEIDKISTVNLIEALCEDDENPWATYSRGKQITPKKIAQLLASYDIQSKPIRFDRGVAKGYEPSQFEDAFSRYLTPSPILRLHGYIPPKANNDKGSDVTLTKNATGTKSPEVTPKPAPALNCNRVTGDSAVDGEEEEITPLSNRRI